MILPNQESPKPILWNDELIDNFVSKNRCKKISLLIWDKDETNICKQIDFSIQNNVDIILSELLPSELPTTLTIKKLNFFRNRFNLIVSSDFVSDSEDNLKSNHTIAFINDGLFEYNNQFSVLKDIRIDKEYVFKELNIDYDNLEIKDITNFIDNNNNFILNIKNPIFLSSVLKYIKQKNKIVKYLNNYPTYSHRLGLMGFFVKGQDKDYNESFRSLFSFILLSDQCILHRSNSVKIINDQNKCGEIFPKENFESQLQCSLNDNKFKNFIETPFFKQNKHGNFQFSLSREIKRFFIYYIYLNKKSSIELNSDFTLNCISESLVMNHHVNHHISFFNFISNIISLTHEILDILILSAIKHGNEFPDQVTQGALGEALIVAKRSSSETISIESAQIVNKVFDTKYKTINNLFFYHKKFILCKKTNRIDLITSILKQNSVNNVAFSNLLNILPTFIDFEDLISVIKIFDISDENFNRLVEGFFLNICGNNWSIIWTDTDEIKSISEKYKTEINLFHSFRPFCSSLLNHLFTRINPSYYAEIKNTSYHCIDYDIFQLIFNLNPEEIKNFYSNKELTSEISVLNLFLNHFVSIMPLKSNETLAGFKSTHQILSELIKDPHELGFLKFLFVEYNHPLSSQVCHLNETLNPIHQQMDNFITSDRLRQIQ